ncbi:hypothetical protein Tco_0495420, partial [Tanacetum coccineum]
TDVLPLEDNLASTNSCLGAKPSLKDEGVAVGSLKDQG